MGLETIWLYMYFTRNSSKQGKARTRRAFEGADTYKHNQQSIYRSIALCEHTEEAFYNLLPSRVRRDYHNDYERKANGFCDWSSNCRC